MSQAHAPEQRQAQKNHRLSGQLPGAQAQDRNWRGFPPYFKGPVLHGWGFFRLDWFPVNLLSPAVEEVARRLPDGSGIQILLYRHLHSTTS
jgi:hypothetical protein